MGNINAMLSNKKMENKKKYENELAFYKKQLEDEKIRTTELKNIINKFTTKYDQSTQNEKKNDRQKLMVELSKIQIKSFVDELLKDKKINIEYLPDYVEKQIYYNIITIVMGIAEHSLSTFKIEFLGHEIDILLHPVSKSIPETTALCETMKDDVLNKIKTMK